MRPGRILWITLAFEGGLAVVALILGAVFGTSPFSRFEPDWGAAGMGVLAALALLAVMAAGIRSRWPPMVRLRQLLDQIVASLFARLTVLDIALVAAVAGIGEEALFRGFLQAALSEPFGPWIALAAASVIFGLVHFVTFTYAVLAALIGACLGWLFIASGNLLVPIVTHAVYDFLALVYLVHIRGAEVQT